MKMLKVLVTTLHRNVSSAAPERSTRWAKTSDGLDMTQDVCNGGTLARFSLYFVRWNSCVCTSKYSVMFPSSGHSFKTSQHDSNSLWQRSVVFFFFLSLAYPQIKELWKEIISLTILSAAVMGKQREWGSESHAHFIACPLASRTSQSFFLFCFTWLSVS